MSHTDPLIHQDDSMQDGVAIIGMSGKFPGAADIQEFWANLLAGKDTITRFSKDELEARNTGAGEGEEYVAARGVLGDAAMFDAEYFGIAPREAERMDPQHRLFLEACSNALEDAGYVSADYPGEIGLFAGCSLNTYLLANLAADRATLDELTGQYQVGEFQIALGNDKDFLTTRAAYKLNLRGPVVSVQSACATSLVAVCQAAQSLMNYACDMALAGGVSVTFPQHRGHVYQQGGIVSCDGHCRAFDADATGTVFGHGVGVVLLKRLDDALRDGDHIAAVIRGFAVNNDGSAKAGYMAPGVDGQARVIAAAQAMAGVGPRSITYVEAHGTGTPLGDPIEIAALTKVFRAAGDDEGFCAVGTAKGNVGHLDAAAGVTGLIKTALSLQHATLPGLKHFKHVNPNIESTASPFVFHGENMPWQSSGPRRAGVSAFGVGGVNAHVVLEEAPALQAGSVSTRGREVLCVSGRTEAEALEAAALLARSLEGASSKTPLADIAFTLNVGRKAHPYRAAVAAANAEDAAGKLHALKHAALSGNKRLGFLFSGQGTQFSGMGHELYTAEPVYRDVIDACAAAAHPLLEADLRDVMFHPEHSAQLEQTSFAQPALFVTELALASLWQSFGVVAETMLGHSLGEYVAATLAGVWTREEAVRLVCRRGQKMQAMEPGAMLSVALPEDELITLAEGSEGGAVQLAALNGPRAGVLAGTFAGIAEIEARLAQRDVATRRLRTSHAFHSAMMQPMAAAFAADVLASFPRAPQRPFVSSVTGTWITAEQAQDAGYWAAQCVRPVRFAAAVETLLTSGVDILLEAGPGETLTTLAMQAPSAHGRVIALPSLTRDGQTRAARTLQDALGSLWSAGVQVDWPGYFAEQRRLRVSLPTYPFQRRKHWVEPPLRPSAPPATVPQSSSASLDFVPPSQGNIALMNAALPSTHPPQSPVMLQRDAHLRGLIAGVFAELSGIETTSEEAEHQFLELGFDSLFLTQATSALSKKFGIKLTFRQMMEEFSSIATLAAHLDAVLAPEAFAVAPSAAQTAALAAPAAMPSGTPIERLLSEQLAAMSKMFAEQVATLQAAAGLAVPAAAAPLQTVPTRQLPVQDAPAADVRMLRPVHAKAATELTPAQDKYVADLVARYAAMTAGSKHATQAGRARLADPRAVAGFRAQWKEMVYPLLVERARGSRLWDVDGNEFIDIVNGYGCILFGHSPEFVVEAARTQLEKGVAIGPQSPLAAEVATLLCELTGNERVTFCNTGSEAVMAAIRVARTVTGRDKFVYFAGDYHGTFDEVLIRNTPRGSAPVAPGIPLANTTNVVVLEYGAQASLAYLRTHADDIAAVLIEPVQTRNPALQPFEFIREVRRITEETGSAMILDEVVTGFRLAPGGVQQFLGIRADMCTYGKVIGGGHPIGVLSGKSMYLDALDGGAWQFGDDSGPEVGVTFFAGTFVRHPLALAAAKAVLTHLKQHGPALQEELNAKPAALAGRLDRFFAEHGVPSRVHSFCSWFYFTFPHDARLASLLYYSMRSKGIHIQEGYPCFLTTAHSDADLAAVEAAFRETILEMQAAGAMPCDLPGETRHAAALLATTEALRVPLTEPQREIFLAAALNDEANCAFNESLTLTLRGAVREEDLRVALDAVLARHDALRSSVDAEGEWLEVAAAQEASTDTRDLRGMDAMSAAAAVVAAIASEAATAFDLVHGPLVRATCFLVAADCAVVVLTAHHIVLDGWSANQMLEEAGRLYSQGRRADMVPLLPFSSYAVLEDRRAKAGEFATNEAYWVSRFKDRRPRLALPVDRSRGLIKSYRGGSYEGRLASELYVDLKRASARAGCTLYVTLLAGFEMLLHRLTGQSEVVVGISTAGQALYEGASLVGHCVHFLPMLSETSAGLSIKDFLRATKTALLDAYDHQEFTYGTLLSKLKLDREPGRLPLIEVQFNLEKVGANVAFDGLAVSIKANAKRYVNTDLFLNVVETTETLEFACDYNSDLFDESTVARWLDEWAVLLRGMAGAVPESAVSALPLLTAQDFSQIAACNDTSIDFGAFESVPTSVLRRAVLEPARIALTCGETTWTYAELTDYAQRLAARLVAEGLQPGGLVGLCVERSPEMLGAVLAVMMAGGAYVPLDPRHPVERLNTVLADAGVTLLIAPADLRLTTDGKRINLAEPLPAARLEPRSLSATHLAYVIYTSGSTGVPKGVAIEHGALLNLLRAMAREPGLHKDDVLVAVTTLAFDIAGLELLLPLLTGAKLVIATAAEVQDGRLLLGRMERAKATVLQATPGAWRLLFDAGWAESRTLGARTLKALCGGEALPRELAERMLLTACEVWNVYGPTETTIWSSATRVEAGEGSLRLGSPIANTQFYVLDERQQMLPIGVTGELYIGGAGLARGYWKREALTAEKFIANPFSTGAPGESTRLYATGDLARRHADGSLELLGRSDFQVKVRGYRIELQEIEAALLAHPLVNDAVVVLEQAPQQAGRGRLAAYVAAGGEAADLPAELTRQLASSLPDYMVPSRIVVLAELPRTANGKLDRKALPQVFAHEPADPSRSFSAPATAEEAAMARIWADVLEVPAVSTTESIFELGADSLLIFRIAARAQRAGYVLNATQIFQHRTVAGVCSALSEHAHDAPVKVTTRITAASRDKYKLPSAGSAGEVKGYV